MSNNNKDTISGIKCNVDTCKHHTHDNKCNADRITVANEHSQTETDTFCATFENDGKHHHHHDHDDHHHHHHENHTTTTGLNTPGYTSGVGRNTDFVQGRKRKTDASVGYDITGFNAMDGIDYNGDRRDVDGFSY